MADAERTSGGIVAGASDRTGRASSAFSLLGNETRLEILLVLWEADDPHGPSDPLSFTEIFDRVAYDDPGNLSYHLDRLVGPFVRRLEGARGYALHEPGRQLVRTVIAGAGLEDAALEPTGIEWPCPFCGAETAVRYVDGLLVHTCDACDGVGPDVTGYDGFLSAAPLEPAALEDRTPDEVFAASLVGRIRQVHAMYEGVCPTCSGPVDGWIEACPRHEPDGGCDRCGTPFAAWARFECRTCRDHSTSPLQGLAVLHPAVVGCYDRHGVSTALRADDLEATRRVFELLDSHGLELVAEEPPRVEVTASVGGDDVTVTFDERARVVGVDTG